LGNTRLKNKNKRIGEKEMKKAKAKNNNKGFSLVELIVVMAIMAILAVTLTPKLSQYIDKARQTNDREAVNAIYSAIRLGMMDDAVYATPKAGITTNGSGTSPYVQNLSGTAATSLYTISGADHDTWTFNAGIADDNLFNSQITEVVGNFKLQSNLAGAGTQITISVSSPTLFSVTLDYDGNPATTNDKYEVNSNEVAVN
jgi:prepilin-type N-terminal cleavage/methylation domain-containing protein